MFRVAGGILAAAAVATVVAASPAGAQSAAQRQAASSSLDRVENLLHGEGVRTKHELTPALGRLAARKSALRASDRRKADSILLRPTDSGDMDQWSAPPADQRVSCSTHFCAHWVVSTADAPPLTDAGPANGRPDYVDALLQAAETAQSVENGTLGWPAPLPDGGRGGNDLTDIYLANIGDVAFGYAGAETQGQKIWTAASYLVMDNDYSSAEFPEFGGSYLKPMQVTVAHEYNHVLQYDFDLPIDDLWLWESTATWAEDKVYDAINDWRRFLPPWAAAPQTPITTSTGTGDRKIYGTAIWNHWIDGRLGADRIRRTWELTGAGNRTAINAYDAAIKEKYAAGLAPQFVEFAAASAEGDAVDSGMYEGAEYFPPVARRAGTLPADNSQLSFNLDHTGYQLVETARPKAGALELTGTLPAGTAGGFALVGRQGTSSTRVVGQLPSGGQVTVRLPNPASYSRVTAVAVNGDRSRDAQPVTLRLTATGSPTPADSDFNGDGFADLAVGVPGENVGSVVDAGLVNVIYGSPAGLAAASGQSWSQSSPGVAGSTNGGERFGAAVASGDFNGDGFDDLAVGAPGDGANVGSVTVLLGSAGGLTGTGSKLYTQDSVGIEDVAAGGDGFGSALAAGALGGGGQDDLAIGAPGDHGGAGVVNVLFGSASGLSQSGDVLLAQDGLGGAYEAGDRFGAAVAAGALGLAVGAPGENAGAGAVSLVPVGLSAAGARTLTQNSAGVPGSDVAGDEMGGAVAIADVAGSGSADLVVGLAGKNGDRGQVMILPAGTTTGAHVRDQDTSGVPDTNEPGDRFGAALVAADVAGDAKADLAIGAPGESVGADAGAGQVTVLLGSTGNLRTTGASVHNQDRPSIADTAEPGDHLGAALATGQWGNGPKADLAFGIPGEDVNAIADAGALATIYGAGTLGPAGNQYIHQATVGIPDGSEAGDAFATGLSQGG